MKKQGAASATSTVLNSFSVNGKALFYTRAKSIISAFPNAIGQKPAALVMRDAMRSRPMCRGLHESRKETWTERTTHPERDLQASWNRSFYNLFVTVKPESLCHGRNHGPGHPPLADDT
jgi:hypothetical protein